MGREVTEHEKFNYSATEAYGGCELYQFKV
jgi:hypothetical protein